MRKRTPTTVTHEESRAQNARMVEEMEQHHWTIRETAEHFQVPRSRIQTALEQQGKTVKRNAGKRLGVLEAQSRYQKTYTDPSPSYVIVAQLLYTDKSAEAIGSEVGVSSQRVLQILQCARASGFKFEHRPEGETGRAVGYKNKRPVFAEG